MSQYKDFQCQDFQIRAMRPDEVAVAIDLAAAEGWNPGMNDAECFFAADPDGFLIGELGGEIVGCISAVSYAGRFGFVGLYIVRPEFRGRGFGMKLWQAAMSRLHGHNVGLDGVVAQQANYAKSGFRLAYRNVRYRGRAEASKQSAPIVPAADVGFAAVQQYDRQIFPERRDEFLRAWLDQPRVGAFAAASSGRLAGYTVVRPCREGWKIGPLAADDITFARQLYAAAAAHAPVGEAIYLDVPEVNSEAQRLVRELALTPMFETARMYTGAKPEIDLSKLFGIMTFELG
jgi:GNAT superfamily N-acetyltransferase